MKNQTHDKAAIIIGQGVLAGAVGLLGLLLSRKIENSSGSRHFSLFSPHMK